MFYEAPLYYYPGICFYIRNDTFLNQNKTFLEYQNYFYIKQYIYFLNINKYGIKVKMTCHSSSADPEGGTGGPDPPWDLSEVGSCVEAWWVGEGVQWLFCRIIINFFWLASLASIIQTYYMVYILQSSIFSMERSSFLYISLIQIMKRVELPIP